MGARHVTVFRLEALNRIELHHIRLGTSLLPDTRKLKECHAVQVIAPTPGHLLFQTQWNVSDAPFGGVETTLDTVRNPRLPPTIFWYLFFPMSIVRRPTPMKWQACQ
jgi:hypothetical protein